MSGECPPQSSSIICSPEPNTFWYFYSESHIVNWNKNDLVFDNVTKLQLQFSYRYPPDNLTDSNVITYSSIDKNASIFHAKTSEWLVPDTLPDHATTPCTLNIMTDGTNVSLSSVRFSIYADRTAVKKSGNSLSNSAVIAICIIVPGVLIILGAYLLTRRRKNGQMIMCMPF
jgi:hypothetical protein